MSHRLAPEIRCDRVVVRSRDGNRQVGSISTDGWRSRDHRPNTTWRLLVDPGTAGDEVGLAVLMERCASGDRIPLHRHDVDEVVIVVAGAGEYHLAGEIQHVEGGDVVFIPAWTVHGTTNTGGETLHLQAVFPSRKVRMEMLERNPAPGTEDQPSMTPVYDFATGGFEVLGPTADVDGP